MSNAAREIRLLPDMPLTDADVAEYVANTLTDAYGTLICRGFGIDPASTDWLATLAVIGGGGGGRFLAAELRLPTVRTESNVHTQLWNCFRRLGVTGIKTTVLDRLISRLVSMNIYSHPIELRYENAVHLGSDLVPR